jgi:hypothetical protein
MQIIPDISEDNMARFWNLVAKSRPGDCWEWQSYKTCLGYGLFIVSRKRYYAHRVSYFLTRSEIPQEMCVLHRCDNPGCVNPDHLFLGTHKDNTQDMLAKGRRPHHHYRKDGFRGHAKKLNIDKIREIRATFVPCGNIRELAEKYGVSKSFIHRIIKGIAWKGVN